MKKWKIMAITTTIAMLLGTVHAFAELPDVDKTDRFTVTNETDEVITMLSEDGELVIHINGQTPVVFEDETDARAQLVDGQTLAELLTTRKLTVTYAITTRSLPPQTSPGKVVIHYEIAVPLPIGIEPPLIEVCEPPLTLNGEIVANGVIITAPAPYLRGEVIMVPLRAVAETLGYDVNWDEEVQGVRLGVAINLFIGKDYYIVGRMAPIELGTAPELTGGVTYVPLSFFRTVTGCGAYWFEGQIVIDNISEPMN